MPDGRLPSRRWRVALWLVAASYGLQVMSLLLIGPVPAGANLTRLAPRWLLTAYDTAQISIALSLVTALAGLVSRARRATGLERRQLTWVLAGAAALVVGTATYLGYGALLGVPGGGLVWAELLFHAGYMAVPVSAGVAVLKYHLYDADRVVSRGVRLATVTILVTAGYVVAVAVIETVAGALVPQRWSGVGTSVAAFVVVVVALQPLQRWLRRFADSVVYRQRAALSGPGGDDPRHARLRRAARPAGPRGRRRDRHGPPAAAGRRRPCGHRLKRQPLRIAGARVVVRPDLADQAG